MLRRSDQDRERPKVMMAVCVAVIANEVEVLLIDLLGTLFVITRFLENEKMFNR